MKKIVAKFRIKTQRNLNPRIPAERSKIIERAVERTVKEYGEALKRLGAE